MSEFEELTTKAMSLPSPSRAELAEILIQSLEEDDDPETKAAWITEIRRRDEQIRSGEKVTRPAHEVLKEARTQLRCMK
ncbi:MAG: addiction module protein [Planctomycetota bacterium]|nr:addiction module protein [Planctomycetota bacterium]MDA1142510.1 addiction module protein [Planctomycetota bacterium]